MFFCARILTNSYFFFNYRAQSFMQNPSDLSSMMNDPAARQMAEQLRNDPDALANLGGMLGGGAGAGRGRGGR